MKTDGRLARNGTLGDALHAVLCGCGHNIRMILAHLRVVLYQIIRLITLLRRTTRGDGRHQELQVAAEIVVQDELYRGVERVRSRFILTMAAKNLARLPRLLAA